MFRFIHIFIFLFLAALLSCSGDTTIEDGINGKGKSSLIWDAPSGVTTSGGIVRPYVLFISSDTAAKDSINSVLMFLRRAVSLADLNKKISVECSINEEALEKYKRRAKIDTSLDSAAIRQDTLLELLPTHLYTLSTSTVEGGLETGPLHISFKPSSFDPAKRYALPVRIDAASDGFVVPYDSIDDRTIIIKVVVNK